MQITQTLSNFQAFKLVIPILPHFLKLESQSNRKYIAKISNVYNMIQRVQRVKCFLHKKILTSQKWQIQIKKY